MTGRPRRPGAGPRRALFALLTGVIAGVMAGLLRRRPVPEPVAEADVGAGSA